MLIEFSFGNFHSFKNKVTLSLVAANIRARDEKINENNTFLEGKLRLLTSAAIYGANASGKSNVIQAFNFMRKFVHDSLTKFKVGEAIPIEPFRLSTETENAPSFFEAVFITDGIRYRYGFELDKNRIVTEWLFHVPKVKEALLFAREGSEFDIRRGFSEGRRLESKTRSNTLFLPVVAQFNGQKSGQVMQWFASIGLISGLQDFAYKPFTISQLIEGPYQQIINDLVTSLDLGLESVSGRRIDVKQLEIFPNMPDDVKQTLGKMAEDDHEILTVETQHKKYNSEGEFVEMVTFGMDEQESEGTQKLFGLSGPIIDTLIKGDVIFIDEMEARLHPLVMRKLVMLFNDKETNPHNAQLIFTTHDTNLLSKDIFRRDQIWFTEKDRYGSSDLYSLAELKVRNDASFENDYIKGRYGAIPYLGGIHHLTVEVA